MFNWLSHRSRAVYLYPASVKQIGGTKWGYINERGKMILKPIYDKAEDFQENGLAIVEVDDQYGVIDTKGYFIVQPKYDYIQKFSEGRAIANDRQGVWVIDESGKEITQKKYSIIGDYQEGRASFAIEGKNGLYVYGYLNRQGKEVIPAAFEEAGAFQKGKAIVKKSDKYSLIDPTGKILKMYPYFYVGDLGEELLVFKKDKDGLYGYIDLQGNIVVEPQFSIAHSFINGRAIVGIKRGKDEYEGLINRSGQFVIKPNYHQLLEIKENHYAIAKLNDPEWPQRGSMYAIADGDGSILTGFNFIEYGFYKNGLTSVSDLQNTYFINKNGQHVKELPTVSGSGWLDLEHRLVKADVDQRVSYLAKSGKMVWKQNEVIGLNEHISVIDQKFKPNKDYLVYYPQIKGMKHPEAANRRLKELALHNIKEIPANNQQDFNYNGDYDITFFKKDLLVIEIVGYDYPFGAAHGMPYREYVQVNVKSGQVYQLKDLFKANSSYVSVNSEIIGKQIKENKDGYYFQEDYHGIKADQKFFINEDGVTIYFYPYEIASYAVGFPTFKIPFQDIMDIINQKGEFWNSFH